jgi:hypothetical protein
LDQQVDQQGRLGRHHQCLDLRDQLDQLEQQDRKVFQVLRHLLAQLDQRELLESLQLQQTFHQQIRMLVTPGSTALADRSMFTTTTSGLSLLQATWDQLEQLGQLVRQVDRLDRRELQDQLDLQALIHL